MTRLLLTSLFLLAAGCEGVLPGIDWQQMNEQHKYQPYEACEWFEDGRAMRPPPLFTVRHDAVVDQPELTEGRTAGHYVTSIPLSLSRDDLSRGRFAYQTYCATCHGMTGDGQAMVVQNFELRRPPSLVTAEVRAFPPGRIFEVISSGYGLMPDYAHNLTPGERWAIVGYLSALQLSQSVKLDELPPELRTAAVRALETP
jgi:mono/diheme cytochrome c family protein